MNNLKRLLCIALGIVSIVLSIVCYCMDTGSYDYNKTYGGDAYTGIQNAGVHTANNVKELAEIEKFGFGSVLLIAGVYLVIVSVCRDKIKTEDLNDTMQKVNRSILGINETLERLTEDKEEQAESNEAPADD